MSDGERGRLMALIELRRRGAAGLEITLSDPSSRNAIGSSMRNELIEALTSITEDSSVRVIILRGADGTFCSGGDLRAMPPSNLAEADQRLKQVEIMVRLLAASPKIVMAVVEGPAVGLGASLVSGCDYVFASEEARFDFPFTRLGLMPDGGIAHTLGARIGYAKARQVLLEGQSLVAEEALRIGLADFVMPREKIDEAVTAKVNLLANRAPLAVSALKSAFADGMPDLNRVFEVELREQSYLYFSEDFSEGKRAFNKQRSAVFMGRQANHAERDS